MPFFYTVPSFLVNYMNGWMFAGSFAIFLTNKLQISVTRFDLWLPAAGHVQFWLADRRQTGRQSGTQAGKCPTNEWRSHRGYLFKQMSETIFIYSRCYFISHCWCWHFSSHLFAMSLHHIFFKTNKTDSVCVHYFHFPMCTFYRQLSLWKIALIKYWSIQTGIPWVKCTAFNWLPKYSNIWIIIPKFLK